MSHILLIDDDPNLLQMVKLMLERVGHLVEISNNGQEGLKMASQGHPDLAIIDVMMPGLSGYDVVRKMRQDPQTSRIPIIILTARSQPMDKNMALEAGANAFLSKPVAAQELTERVDAVLKAGVDYRVHTGLLTEPVDHKPASFGPAPPLGQPRTPVPGRSGGRVPIGADDMEYPTDPTPPRTQLPITTVISPRGGSGSTTVAINVASVLTGHGQRVCLVDLSQAGGHIPLHLHIAPQHHWGELLGMGDMPDPRVLRQSLIAHPASGMMVLPAPPVPAPQTLTTPAMQSVLKKLSGAFNQTIVDAQGLDPASIGALLMAHTVIIVMSDDPPAVQTTSQFLTTLNNMGVNAGHIRVVLNHVRSTPDVSLRTIEKALKRPLTVEIPFATNMPATIRRGVPLAVMEPDSPYAQAIQQLARTMVPA